MKRKIQLIILKAFSFLPIVELILKTIGAQTPIRPRMWFIQKVLGFNSKAYWPVHHASTVTYVDKILAGIDVSPGYMSGCYIQGSGGIVIGDYTQIACNVGIISRNHDVHDCRLHIDKHFPSVNIGEYCWIGMNSIILPGVTLGDFTIVGAGSVVTKSFPNGYCVVAGNPARLISQLDPKNCIKYKNEHEFYGYIEKSKMPKFRKKNLSI